MTAATDLTTLDAVKQWLGVTSPTDDALIGGLITAVSQAILADLGRGSLLPTVYTETFDGGGRDLIGLGQWPVTQILSVALDGMALGASGTSTQRGYVLDAAGAAPPGAMQRLAYRGGIFPRGRQNVVVAYRAGYEVLGEPAAVPAAPPYTVTAAMRFGAWRMDTGAAGAMAPYSAAAGVYTFAAADAGRTMSLSYGYVPSDLAQAALEWVADRYVSRARIGQSAKTLGGQETTSFIVKPMPDVVDRLLQPYRRVAR